MSTVREALRPARRDAESLLAIAEAIPLARSCDRPRPTVCPRTRSPYSPPSAFPWRPRVSATRSSAVGAPVEQRLLAAYADQLAMALDNTALFEEAETQKTLLEHIFASTSDGLLFRDRTGQVAALNRRGEELLVSDGILEIPDAHGRRPGLAGLAALLEKVQDRPPVELAETIVEDAVVRSGAVLRDDVTVVTLRR